MVIAVDCLWNMKFKNQENNGISISGNFDKNQYSKLIKNIKLLIKNCENDSKIDDLKYTISMKGMRTPYIKTKGWSSRIIDSNGKISHVVFLDYDNILFYLLKEELSYLVNKFNLSPFYVFSTYETMDKTNSLQYGNYIAISLTKKNFKEIIDINKETSSDIAHKNVPLNNYWKAWVLRLGNKKYKPSPKFKEIIGDTKREYNQEISNAHLKVIEGLYDVPKIKYNNKDKNDVDKLYFNTYITASL